MQDIIMINQDIEKARNEYRYKLEHNKLFIPTNFILYYNWQFASLLTKLKYLVKYRSLHEAKMQLAIDYKIDKITEISGIKDE